VASKPFQLVDVSDESQRLVPRDAPDYRPAPGTKADVVLTDEGDLVDCPDPGPHRSQPGGVSE